MNADEMLAEMKRWKELLSKPVASKLKMNHAGYELIRDEIPLASERLRYLGLPHQITGLEIIIDNDMPPDRIVIIDQYGHLFDVILL